MKAADFQAQYGKHDKASPANAKTKAVSDTEDGNITQPSADKAVRAASMDEQREAYRSDWHERQIPKEAVLVDSWDNGYVYEYVINGFKYQVTINVKIII